MNWTRRLGRWLAVSVVGGGTCVSVGCLARPVGGEPPTTKVNFTATISQQQVDKVDLLFVIDNSTSMKDKQDILADAVPTLLRGLLEPKCLDKDGKAVGKDADPHSNQGLNYGCPAGSEPEFRPVTDMHIGIVSSSLGGMGGDVCADTNVATKRDNDRGHLLNISEKGGALAVAEPSNFLSWYPTNDENTKDKKRHPDPPTAPINDLSGTNGLEAHFQDLVKGVGQSGCGFEAQLESFYHFLIQPDPWVKVTQNGDRASLGPDNEIDVDILKQRANFLRPDSLVAIIELTDEDDSSPDPLSVRGQGFYFGSNHFADSKVYRPHGDTTTAPRATSVCKTDPGKNCTRERLEKNEPCCTSCVLASAEVRANDEECKLNGGYYGPTEDSLNVRFFHMKQRFGIDPQYPIQRYVDGLRNRKVPNRATEHELINGIISDYVLPSKPTCTNPLFAKELPREAGQELCNLPLSTRDPNLIFFAVVGGVPNNLLHFDPNDADKSAISEADWEKILGRDPAKFDYTGIDPHMRQSTDPRDGVPAPSLGGNGDPKDPVGRDWVTNGEDLQYACTFDLPVPRPCPEGDDSCDCNSKDDKSPPLCDPTDANKQVKAKAYPTIREFMVVREMKDQGIIASLCPIQLDKKDTTSPTYGYNPAVKSIIDRLKNALTVQCLPQKLTRDTVSTDENKDTVPCLVLAQLAEGDQATACNPAQGLSDPAPEVLSKFKEAQKAASGNIQVGGEDLSRRPVCELKQLVAPPGESCRKSPDFGWCYVENGNGQSPAGKCPQALLFSEATGALAGASFSLQCIQQFQQRANAPAAAP